MASAPTPVVRETDPAITRHPMWDTVPINFTEEQWHTIREMIGRGSPQKAQSLLDDLALSNALQIRLREIVEEMQTTGKEVSYEYMHSELDRIAREHGCEYGIPFPDLLHEGEDRSHPLVLADGVPLAWTIQWNEARTEAESELAHRHVPVTNSWDRLGDETICVVQTEKGPYAWKKIHAGARLRRLMQTMLVRSRSPLTADSELRAIESLRKRISKAQFDSYMLNGAFPERSKRSDLHYIFRKGLPTLVLSYHGNPKDGGRVLCALCQHPMGYYAGTNAGLMTPTDEVISALLMMRSDEHKFWAKSGQWHPQDTRSGI